MTLPDHRVFFFFPFSADTHEDNSDAMYFEWEKKFENLFCAKLVDELNLRLGEFCQNDTPAWIPQQHQRSENDTGQKEAGETLLPAADFVDVAYELASGNFIDDAVQSRHWVFDANLRETIQQHHYPVNINKSSRKRLSLPESILISFTLEFAAITLYASGIGYLMLEINYSLNKDGQDWLISQAELNTPWKVIGEANYILCHTKPSYQSHIQTLSEDLFKLLDLENQRIDRRRQFTYTGIALRDELNLKECAALLATKQTPDYFSGQLKQAKKSGILELYQPFPHMVHAVSMEGGALVYQVKPEDSTTSFMGQYLERTLTQSYLSLARLSLHQNLLLNRMSASLASLGEIKRMDEESMKKLVKLRRNMFQYRLRYRFLVISNNPLQIVVHKMWNKTLQLERHEHQLADDLEQLEAYVYAERMAKWQKIGALLSAFVAMLGVGFTLDRMLNAGVAETLLEILKSTSGFPGFTGITGKYNWILVLIISAMVGFIAYNSTRRTGNAPTTGISDLKG